MIIYPGGGIHQGLVDCYHGIGHYIMDKFPQGYFRSVQFNTKDGFYSQYYKLKRSRMKGHTGVFEQKRTPRFIFVIDDKNNDLPEPGFSAAPNPYIWPLNFGIHPHLSDYLEFFKDPSGISLYTTNRRMRVDFEVIIEHESASDQESSLNYFENTIKVMYGDRLFGITGGFILPNDMMKFMRTTLYFNTIQDIKKEKNGEIRDRLYNEIQKDFDNRLVKYSSNQILPKINPNNPNKRYYIYNRTYNQIYFQITAPPNKSDGEKRNEIYDKFTVTAAGFFEIYKPVSWVLKSPDIVDGVLFNDIVQVSREMNKKGQRSPIGFAPFVPNFKTLPSRILTFVENQKYTCEYTEYEITFDNKKDNFDLIEWLADEKFHGKYEYLWKDLQNMSTEDFNKKYILIIYEGSDVLMDDEDIMFEKGMVYVQNIDITKLYSLFLLRSPEHPIKQSLS
jgi:hypothetical protein